MTVNQIIAELEKCQQMFGDIPLEVMIEDPQDRRNRGMLGVEFIDIFTNVRRGEGRVAILRLE